MKMSSTNRVCIIGAGPAGIGAAYRLRDFGHSNIILYEEKAHPGGLCASFIDEQGFIWDQGGHVLFSSHDYFNASTSSFENNTFVHHRRNAGIILQDRWIPYPFQDHLSYLSANAESACIKGLKNRHNSTTSDNFKQWIHATFGDGIARYFMMPYNTKLWRHPLEDMSINWVADRISNPELTKSRRKPDPSDWGANATFAYPEKGGFGSIIHHMSQCFDSVIHYSSSVSRVDPYTKTVYLENGNSATYDILINTMPLERLVMSLTGADAVLADAANNLHHTSVCIIGLGIKGTVSHDKSWVYFPEPDYPFFRVTYLSNYSPYTTPDPASYYSLLCEISFSPEETIHIETLIENTIQGLSRAGMLPACERDAIVSTFTMVVPYAYPVPTSGRDKALETIHTYLESRDMYSRGRFGAWKYEVGNTDHSFMQGKELVDRLFGTGREHVWSN